MRLKIDILHKQGAFVLDADLQIETSSTGIFGHSGSGKSTLLRCIAGLIRPSTGSIELDHETLFDSCRRIWIPPHKRRIGIVFQEPRLFPHWSVRQNLQVGKPRSDHRPYSEDNIIALLQIDHLLERPIKDLSGGEKQRISLARTLLSYPRLLLMDEPLAALDSRLKSRILPFLDCIHREFHIPTLMVSHDLTEILRLSDHLILLKDGRVLAHDTLNKMIHHDEMTELIQERNLYDLIAHQLRGRCAMKREHHEQTLSH